MSQREIELMETMAEATPLLDNENKAYIEGYIAGAVARKKKEEDQDHKEEA